MVGLMPALRVRSRTSRTCASVISVTTVPDAPARAVRPERCRYALCSTGGSAWMTRRTSSTWMPRAAMSVATSVFAAPEENASRLRVRAFWPRLPCSSTAGTPDATSLRVSAFARLFVRVNTSVRPGAAVRSTSTGSRWVSSRCSTWCSIVDTGDCAESTLCVTGSLMKRLTSTSTPLSRVAENSIRWPRDGVASMIRRTSGRKPRSAMWSASSRTVISMVSSFTCPERMWSASRPGQATTMSTPSRSLVICGLAETPPKMVVVRRPSGLASGTIAASICVASSRVGARISARGRPGLRRVGPAERRASRGSTKP